MFDIGFAELLLIAVIGLLVIGPQRLPETVRALALWIGRLRRAVSRAYREVEKEVGMDEIRRQLHNEEIMRQFSDDQSRKTDSQNQAAAEEPGKISKKEP